MLLPSYLRSVADPVVEIWETLNLWAVKDMARRIADAGGHMTDAADYTRHILIQSGKSQEELKKELKKTLNASDEEIEKIFEEALQNSYDADAKIFAEAGVKTQPFATLAGRAFIKTLYEQTNGTLENLTRTMAEEHQKTFINACSGALARVSSGLQSQEAAIREAIEQTAAAGLTVTYESGHTDTIEVAVRRAVQTGTNQAALRMTLNECEEMGTNCVIVSSHLGARVSKDRHGNHAGWQGGVYRIADRGQDFYGSLAHLNDQYGGGAFELLEEATGFPSDPLGLGGYNCRHSMYPYVPGISENHMQEFDAEENRETYEATQKQRAMERKMREERRQIEALKAAAKTAPTDAISQALDTHRRRYQDMLKTYRAFCAAHGLAEQLNRTYTASV